MDPQLLTTITTHLTTRHSHGIAIQAALRKLPGFFFPYDLDAAFHPPFIAPHRHPADPRVLYDLVASQTRDNAIGREEGALDAALSFFLRKLLRRCCMVWRRAGGGGGTPLGPDLFWGLVAVDTLAGGEGERELPSVLLRHGETLEAVVGYLVAAVVPEGLMASSPQLAMMDPENGGDWEVFRAVKEWMAVGRGGG